MRKYKSTKSTRVQKYNSTIVQKYKSTKNELQVWTPLFALVVSKIHQFWWRNLMLKIYILMENVKIKQQKSENGLNVLQSQLIIDVSF